MTYVNVVDLNIHKVYSLPYQNDMITDAQADAPAM